MKLKYLLLVAVLLGASAYFYQVDVTPEGEVGASTQMGWPFAWLEANAAADGSVTYNVIPEGLIIDIAVYGICMHACIVAADFWLNDLDFDDVPFRQAFCSSNHAILPF